MAELWTALHDGSLTCSERLKVAAYLWKQQEVRGMKWRLLLKWTLEQVCRAYDRRSKSPPPSEVRCQLWQLLSVMLESVTTSDVELWDGETSPSKHFCQSVCDVLNEAAASDSNVSDVHHVLKCLCSILSAPMLPPILHKFDIVVSLLQATLKLAMDTLKYPAILNHLIVDVFKPLEQLLRYFVIIQGSQGNPKKVFTSTCQQLLPAVLRLKYHIIMLRGQDTDVRLLCDQVDIQLKNFFLAIFNRDHLSEFTSAVTISDAMSSTRKRSAISYARVLFEILSKMATAATSEEEEKDDHLAVVEGLPKLYASFLQQNRQEEMVSKVVEFKFFNKLLSIMKIEEIKPLSSASADPAAAMETSDVADLNLEQILRKLSEDGGSEGSDNDHQNVLIALYKCLELVWKFNVHQVAEDRDSGGEQFAILQHLALIIMRGLRSSSMVESYDCLAIMVRLNHQLLEPWLPQLCLLLMLTHRKLSKDALGLECVTIFAKLRQLPQFLSKLLESLDLFRKISTSPSSFSMFPSFAPSTQQLLFAECVSVLPPGQCAEVLELIVFHLIKVCRDVASASLEALMPPLERMVEISTLVLSHLPLDFWSGKQREKAHQLLQDLINVVVLPLLKTCPLKKFNARLSSVTLMLLSECCNLLAHLHVLSFSVLPYPKPVEMTWNEELDILIPELWSDLCSIDVLNSLGRHLLRKMAFLRLRFDTNESSTTHQQLLSFILGDTPDSSEVGSTWTGQLLDLVATNEHVGYWSLLLSQLSFIYCHLSKQQLEVIAEEMVKALLSRSESERDKSDTATIEYGHHKEIGINVVELFSRFLESEGFVEMNALQEVLLNKFCTHLSSLMRRSLPKPLRKTAKCLSSLDSHIIQAENLIVSLSEMLQRGLELQHNPQSENVAAASTLLNKINLPLIIQLIRNFQLCSLSQAVLLQSLAVFLLLHMAITQQMRHMEHQKEAAALLEELDHHLSWLVLSLVRVREREDKLLRSSKKKKKKKRRTTLEEKSDAGVPTEVPTISSLLNSFSMYIYGHMTMANIQVLDMPSSLLASTLVAMEITLDAVMRMGGYPSELLEKVVVDLQRKPKDDPHLHLSSVAVRCLYIIANVSCKKPTSCQGGESDSEKNTSVVLEHTVATIEKLITRKRRKKPSATSTAACLEVVQDHPVLVSTLALLLHYSPGLISARHVEIISLLCGVTEEVCSTVLLEKPHAQYELVSFNISESVSLFVPSINDTLKLIAIIITSSYSQMELHVRNHIVAHFVKHIQFCGVVDLLSLPAAIVKSHSTQEEVVESMNTTNDEERLGEQDKQSFTLKSLLVISWERLLKLLECTFSEALQAEHQHLLHVFEQLHSHGSKTLSRMEEEKKLDIVGMLCAKIARTMTVLLSAASSEELQVILEQLLPIKEHYPVSSVLMFSFSWCLVVDTKLHQEKRNLIRKYLQRVLVVCQSIVVQDSSDTFCISLVIQVITHLLSLHPSIGLDHVSVLLALELCVFTAKLETEASPFMTAAFVVAEAELLSALLRQHVSIANSTPAPIITAVNRLFRFVIQLGRIVSTSDANGLSENHTPPLLDMCVNSASKLSRLLETLSQKASFSKFAVYLVHGFLTSQAKATAIHADVKGALLPGVFNLLKLCSPNDIAFIKASIDQATRDSFQTLTEEYQRYHKFGGRV